MACITKFDCHQIASTINRTSFPNSPSKDLQIVFSCLSRVDGNQLISIFVPLVFIIFLCLWHIHNRCTHRQNRKLISLILPSSSSSFAIFFWLNVCCAIPSCLSYQFQLCNGILFFEIWINKFNLISLLE
jgi:hypothetical protein